VALLVVVARRQQTPQAHGLYPAKYRQQLSCLVADALRRVSSPRPGQLDRLVSSKDSGSEADKMSGVHVLPSTNQIDHQQLEVRPPRAA
jgi:hypothetical protein